MYKRQWEYLAFRCARTVDWHVLQIAAVAVPTLLYVITYVEVITESTLRLAHPPPSYCFYKTNYTFFKFLCDLNVDLTDGIRYGEIPKHKVTMLWNWVPRAVWPWSNAKVRSRRFACGPVSYTHLDVYKRQLPRCVCVCVCCNGTLCNNKCDVEVEHINAILNCFFINDWVKTFS